MSNQEDRKPSRVCRDCKHLDWDSKDEYSPIEYFCLLGLIYPVKDSCKRKQTWSRLP